MTPRSSRASPRLPARDPALPCAQQLFVRLPTGRTLALDVPCLPNAALAQQVTAGSLRHRVAAATGIPAAEQRLLFHGRQLSDTAALAPHSTLTLLLRLAGGGNKGHPRKRMRRSVDEGDRTDASDAIHSPTGGGGGSSSSGDITTAAAAAAAASFPTATACAAPPKNPDSTQQPPPSTPPSSSSSAAAALPATDSDAMSGSSADTPSRHPGQTIEWTSRRLIRLIENNNIRRLRAEVTHKNANESSGDDLVDVPLQAAAHCNNIAAAVLLLERGADVQAQSGVCGFSALHHAVEQGSTAMVNVLLAYGANPSLHNEDGDTPLHMAAQNGHEAIAGLLLDAGADANAPNGPKGTGFRPLHDACFYGHTAVAALLLEFGADDSATTHDGRTPATVNGDISHSTLRAAAKTLRQKRALHVRFSE